MNNSSISAKGQLDIRLYDSNLNLKQSITVPNLVVATGRVHLAQLLAGQSPTPMSHMAIGEGTTTPSASDTALQSEFLRATLTSVTRTDNSVTYSATFDQGTGTDGLVTEAGIFNSGTTGDMLCRSVFGVVTKTEEDILTINWTVSIV